jgi:hypothetical protein
MGSHTYDVVAEHLMNIHSDFGLDHTNIAFTVTDNGSNMVKSFAEYQEQEVRPEQDLEDVNDDNAIDDPSEYENC